MIVNISQTVADRWNIAIAVKNDDVAYAISINILRFDLGPF